MGLIELMIALSGSGEQAFRRPGRPWLVLGNSMDPEHEDYDRTPYFAFEMAGGAHKGERVLLSLQSYEAEDWEMED